MATQSKVTPAQLGKLVEGLATNLDIRTAQLASNCDGTLKHTQKLMGGQLDNLLDYLVERGNNRPVCDCQVAAGLLNLKAITIGHSRRILDQDAHLANVEVIEL